MTAPKLLRTDIQVLRGFAVLIVLFYHAKLTAFPAGYLGVDVFFVISGFLITNLIKNSIDNGTFRFSDFYFRRAKRLLPAAYVTFLFTALLSPIFLTSAELKDFSAQMAGAVSFSANFVLKSQSGYFEGEAALKPLLHTWSLAIEEQYYFIIPALMVFTPRFLWLPVTSCVLISSLLLCLSSPGIESTFFLLPSRAWELSIGSFGALLPQWRIVVKALRLAFWPSFTALLVIPMIPSSGYHPGGGALLICLSTLVVILRMHPLLFKGMGMLYLARVGDISYSLYLVHWPLFAFLNNIWIAEGGSSPPFEIRFALLLLSILFAYLLNRFVEEPVRSADIKASKRLVSAAVSCSFALALVASGITYAAIGDRDYKKITRRNYGFDKKCASRGEFVAQEECQNSKNPEFLVWGDSFAMHLIPGLISVESGDKHSVAQATRSSCGPLLRLAPESRTATVVSAEAKSCIGFNNSVLNYLKSAESIKTVVVSSALNYYFDDYGSKVAFQDAAHIGEFLVVDNDVGVMASGFKRTVDALRALGKNVVVIAPPPAGGFNIARCVERLERRLPTIGVSNECRISVDSYQKNRRQVLELIGVLSQYADVNVIDFSDYLCDDRFCRTYIDGTFIYRDEGHFSHEGSALLAKKMDLFRRIIQVAH